MDTSHVRLSAVLVVEDDDSTRAALEAILSSAGHFVLGVPNGAAALACLQRVKPDAVVTDLNMPELDGAELCRTIRSSHATCDLPVIAVSSEAQELTPLGLFNAYFRKPVSPEQLICAVTVATAGSAINRHMPASSPHFTEEADE